MNSAFSTGFCKVAFMESYLNSRPVEAARTLAREGAGTGVTGAAIGLPTGAAAGLLLGILGGGRGGGMRQILRSAAAGTLLGAGGGAVLGGSMGQLAGAAAAVPKIMKPEDEDVAVNHDDTPEPTMTSGTL